MNRKALRELIWNEDRVMSWGNGWITNGHWMLKHPFLSEGDKLCFGWWSDRPADLELALKPSTETKPGKLRMEGKRLVILVKPDELHFLDLYVVEPGGILLRREYLEGLMHCLGSSVYELAHEVSFKLGIIGPEQPVFVFDHADEIHAVLMPVKQ